METNRSNTLLNGKISHIYKSHWKGFKASRKVMSDNRHPTLTHQNNWRYFTNINIFIIHWPTLSLTKVCKSFLSGSTYIGLLLSGHKSMMFSNYNITVSSSLKSTTIHFHLSNKGMIMAAIMWNSLQRKTVCLYAY